MPHNGYSPNTSSVTPVYVVNTTGDRFFIPAYPEVHVKADDLANCQKLSPKGLAQVA